MSFHLSTPITAWRTHDPRLPVLPFDSSSTTPHKTEFTTSPLPLLLSLSFFNATSPLIGNDLLSLIKPEETRPRCTSTLSEPHLEFAINHNKTSKTRKISQQIVYFYYHNFRVDQLLRRRKVFQLFFTKYEKLFTVYCV